MSSRGTKIHSSTYATTAMPSRVQTCHAITTNARPNRDRTASELTPKFSASPPATPAITLSEALRRSGRRAGTEGSGGGISVVTGPGVSASVGSAASGPRPWSSMSTMMAGRPCERHPGCPWKDPEIVPNRATE
jgi:hypothetical protein